MDRARSRRSERARGCGGPWWRIRGQLGPPVDGFGPWPICPQSGPVVPMVIPSCEPSCTQALWVSEALRFALVSDERRMWMRCGQPVESAWTTLWTLCGFRVGGMWVVSASSQAENLLGLWANCTQGGEKPLCINEFEDSCVRGRTWPKAQCSLRCFGRLRPRGTRVRSEVLCGKEKRFATRIDGASTGLERDRPKRQSRAPVSPAPVDSDASRAAQRRFGKAATGGRAA